MHSKGVRVKVIAFAFIAIALPFVVNEWFGASFHKSDALLLRIFNPEYWYRKSAPGRPSQGRINEIRVVSIARGEAPGSVLGENRCTHRAFMAELLNKLATKPPSLVVIDKWYNKIPLGVCPKDKDGNETDGTPSLRAAIRNLAANTKIVIAVASYTSDEAGQICSEPQAQKLQLDEMVLAEYEPLIDFGPLDERNNKPGEHVRWGLARLNVDIRKIPLGWMAFRDCGQIATARPMLMPSLATAAATLEDEAIMNRHNLSNMQGEVTHPYTKLIPEADKEGFQVVPAIDLMCKEGVRAADWRNCASGEPDRDALQSLEGKKIIIGETKNDFFHTDEGNITGPALQANYLASMLSDNSILSPLPRWVNLTISGAWLAFVFAIFYWWLKHSPALAALVSAGFTVALGMVFTGVISRQFGIFTDLLPPTILEIIGLYLARKIELLLEHRQPERIPKERHGKKVSL